MGALWGMALRVAMEKSSRLWICKLEKTARKMQACVENEPVNIRRFQTLHESFHGEPAVMAGNKRLEIICDNFLKQIRGTTAKRFMDREHLKSSMRYHLEILEAIKANDTELAVKLTWNHIVDAFEALNKCYFTLDQPEKSPVQIDRKQLNLWPEIYRPN
jgi:DNA-binding GntR family transcriptional regulator